MWVVVFTGFPISNVNECHRPMRNYWIMAIIIYIFNIDLLPVCDVLITTISAMDWKKIARRTINVIVEFRNMRLLFVHNKWWKSCLTWSLVQWMLGDAELELSEYSRAPL